VAYSVRSLTPLYAALVMAPPIFLVYSLATTATAVPTILHAARARPANPQVRNEKLLLNAVEEMAIAAGLPVPKTYVQDDADINAFAAGKRPDEAIICVSSAALAALDQEELQGVIGHEMSHIRNHDIRVTTVAVAVVGFFAVTFDVSLRLVRGRGRRPAQLFLIVAVAWLAYLLGRLTYFALSRQREYLADASGAQLTRNPAGLASALAKIAARQPTPDRGDRTVAALYLDNPFRRGLRDSVWSTHPPLDARIKRLGGAGLEGPSPVRPMVSMRTRPAATSPVLFERALAGTSRFCRHCAMLVGGAGVTTCPHCGQAP